MLAYHFSSLLGVSRGPRSRVSPLHRSPSIPAQASEKLLCSGLLLKLCDLDLDMTLDGHLPLAIGRSSCLDLLFFRFADAHARESLYDLREQAGEVKQGSQLFLQESLACLMLKISALLDMITHSVPCQRNQNTLWVPGLMRMLRRSQGLSSVSNLSLTIKKRKPSFLMNSRRV